jgi:cytochrome c oxidase assembly protein subunit 11
MSVIADPRRNQRTALATAAFALGMLGLGYAAVPLYDLFCRATGFGGTTMRVSEAQAEAIHPVAQKISIRFDGNVDRDMPWSFGPEQITQDVHIGERTMAYFRARNNGKQAVTGVASFNVAPERAGKYFNKIHCFCFNLQTLQPGQEVDMPVQYYVDPAILTDPEARDIEQITLSYTFHTSVEQPAKALDQSSGAR